MARPWFSYKAFEPRRSVMRPRCRGISRRQDVLDYIDAVLIRGWVESRRQWHSRMRVSDLGWAIGGARYQARVKRGGVSAFVDEPHDEIDRRVLRDALGLETRPRTRRPLPQRGTRPGKGIVGYR